MRKIIWHAASSLFSFIFLLNFFCHSIPWFVIFSAEHNVIIVLEEENSDKWNVICSFIAIEMFTNNSCFTFTHPFSLSLLGGVEWLLDLFQWTTFCFRYNPCHKQKSCCTCCWKEEEGTCRFGEENKSRWSYNWNIYDNNNKQQQHKVNFCLNSFFINIIS